MYTVVKPIMVRSEDGTSSRYIPAGKVVELTESQAAEHLAAGRIQHEGIEGATGTVLDGAIETLDEEPEPGLELVDEPEEKPLKAYGVDELKALAKELGVKPDIADNLRKPELLEVVTRMQASSD